MPPVIASDILDDARGTYLNDPLAGTFTNEKLLPHLKTAYGFLEAELRLNGVQSKNEEAILTLAANSNELFPLPPDLVIPRRLQQRTPGSNEEFQDVDWYPEIGVLAASPYILGWTWRVERILTNRVSIPREVRLYYQQSYPAVNASNVTLFGKAESYLAAKTAALAHLFLSQSLTLAKESNNIAEQQLATIITEQVKMMQLDPVRHKAYIPGHRR